MKVNNMHDHDENAALVWKPPMKQPAKLHNVTIGAEHFLKVCDIASLPFFSFSFL